MGITDDIHGYFGFPNLYERMVDKAASLDRPMVEVGVWCGMSLFHAANYAKEKHPNWKKLIGVDTFRDMDNAGGSVEVDILGAQYASLMQCLHHRERLSLTPYAHIIIGRSVETASLFADGSLACVFIDGAHDTASVLADINAWASKVHHEGIIAGHDSYHPPVESAVREYFGEDFEIDEGCWIANRGSSNG